jgi:hypothetical protein
VPSAFDLLMRPVPRQAPAAPALGTLTEVRALRPPEPDSMYHPDAEEYDLARGTACKRGYDRQWRNVRAEFLAAHPKCSCGEPAVLVDHIIEVRRAPNLRLAWSNLQGMCRSCHGLKTVADAE